MSILVECPACAKTLSAPNDAAGKKLRCAKCKTVFVIEDPDESSTPERAISVSATTNSHSPRDKEQERQSEGEEDDTPWRPRASGRNRRVESKRLSAGLCALLIPGLGVHKFILGYTGAGLTMLLVTVLSCCWGGLVMIPIGIIEGVTYLTMSDEAFYQRYQVECRPWF